MRARKREERLHQRDGQRERQRELSELGNHFTTVFCAFCAASTACAASGGM